MKYENVERASKVINGIKNAEDILKTVNKMKDASWNATCYLEMMPKYDGQLSVDLDEGDVERILGMLEERYSKDLEEYKKELKSL